MKQENLEGIEREWWDLDGKFAPLHKIDFTRLSYIKKQIDKHFRGVEYQSLKAIDIGCGGGILTEPLARMGINMSGLDISQLNIDVAQSHARKVDLDINYQCVSVEEYSKSEKKFDIVFIMEVVEHIDDLNEFLLHCAKLLKDGGMMFISTINRTIKSFISDIICAEYIFRMLPIGTHSWSKFLKPYEVDEIISEFNISLDDVIGMKYSSMKKEFYLSEKDISMNYIMTFIK